MLASRVLLDRMIAEATSPHTVRRTTFLAFRELEIDQLYYLAQQKAEREVGAGMEAYDVKIGSQGVPLTGDESRESWPASYKCASGGTSRGSRAAPASGCGWRSFDIVFDSICRIRSRVTP